MNVLESHPLLCFFICSLLLYHIYGFAWTLVIIFTLYLLDRTFHDTQSERIFGKPLTRNHNKVQPVNGFCGPSPIIFNRGVVSPINMSANKDNSAKRPTLQSLLYKKGNNNSGNRGSRAHPRQPLAAIVKNNIQMNLSPNIDLERKKPIFQTLRSPITSPSVYATRNASPLARRMRSSLNIASPLSARLTPANKSSNDKSLNESPNETLEVHGSYFINKSILHSPSSASAVDKPSPRYYFSPSNVTFNTDTRSPASPCVSKTSTESVVQALKEKSKRKRTLASTSDEACTKKKKTNEDSFFDSTLNELLPSVPSEKSAKRRNIDNREVMSTGVQCYISDDETVARKKKKPSDTSTTPKPRFGLSQGELNNLSQEIDDATKMTEKTDDQNDTNTTPATAGKGTPSVSFDQAVRSIAYDCSFKTMSFADMTTGDADVSTPDKRLSAVTTRVIDRSASKLSALKNMESPYKKLFSGVGDGLAVNVSPASAKKLRKHPIYFTAKIDIDEVQQHHEEFGESGVSLKAFRLNQEESIKRVNSLFDDTDAGADVDFKIQSSTATLTTATASITTTATSVSVNLFGCSTAGDSKGASLFTSSIATSTSGFSFGSLTASGPSAPAVSSSTGTKTETSLASTSVLTGLKMLNTLAASVNSPSKPAVTPAVATAAVSTVSVPAPTAVVPTFNFGSLALSSAAPVASTSVASAQAPSSSASVPLATGFSFGFGAAASEASTVATEPPSQFAPSTQPQILPTATSTEQPVTSKISFSIAIQPSNTVVSTTTTTAFAAPTSTSTGPAFNFSFQPKSSTAETTEAVSTAVQTVFPAPTFNFAASSAPATSQQLGGLSFLSTASGVTAASATPPLTACALPAPTTTTTSITAIPSLPSVFSFGAASSSAATTTTSPAMFGSATTTTQPTQPSLFGSALPTVPMFGNAASTAASTIPSMFGTSSAAPPSFSFGAANVPSFNQSAAAASTAAPITTASAIFGGMAATAAATTAGIGGFSFTPASAAAPSTGFSFGVPSASSAATNANIFSVAQSSIFGQAAAPTATVAPAAAGSIFGTVSSATSSIFGGPAVTATAPATQNIFGAPAATSVQSSQSIFGGGATQTSFGAPAAPATGVFGGGGAATGNPFATTTTQPASIFGAPQPKPATGGFNFGASAATAPAPAPSTGFSFGAATTSSNSIFGATTNSGSVFGGTTAPTNNGGSMFGAAPKPTENIFAQPAKPASGFDFSSSLTQGPSINFGVGGGTASATPAVNGFGAPQAQNEIPKPTFNFGASQPATPSFASPAASPAFGAAPQPSFGAAPAPTFGTPGAGGGGFTIGAGTSNPPPRQTRNARRRLRR